MHGLVETPENLLKYSEDITQSDWSTTAGTVTSNAIAAPDGSLTADLFDKTVDEASELRQIITGTAVSTYYTFSVWLKKYTDDAVNISIYDNTSNNHIASKLCDLSSGEWERFSVGGITNGSDGNIKIFIHLWTGATNAYSWGAQLSKGAPIPYIKTEASVYAGPYVGIDFDPEYNLKTSGRKVETRQRVWDGSEKVYKWGEYEEFKMSVAYMPALDGKTITDWWTANTELLYIDIDTKVSSVHLVNKEQPVNQLTPPYTGLWKGKIELGTY